MVKNISVKTFASYEGHNIKSNGAISLRLKIEPADLTEAVQLLQMLNSDITVNVKINAEPKPIKIGVFTLHNFKVDRDGESVITLNSTTDYAETNLISKLIPSEDENAFKARFDCKVEVEDAENENDEDIK